MVLSLFLTTLIISVIFLPVAFYFSRSGSANSIAMISYGGATWAVVAIIQLVVLQILNILTTFPIAAEISLETIAEVQTVSRTVLFWYIFFISLIGQIVLYNGSIRFKLVEGDNPVQFFQFGIGWGLSEFIQRFLFLNSDIILKIYMFVFILILASSIGATIIRTPENTKFIMFATFLKFIAEMGIFGGLGYDHPEFYQEATYILLLIIFMTGLAMITRKYPLQEDDQPNVVPS